MGQMTMATTVTSHGTDGNDDNDDDDNVPRQPVLPQGQTTTTSHGTDDVLEINRIVVVCLLHYISVKRTTVDICTTLVPSVACQTTEGEYLLLTILPTY